MFCVHHSQKIMYAVKNGKKPILINVEWQSVLPLMRNFYMSKVQQKYFCFLAKLFKHQFHKMVKHTQIICR